MTNPITRAHAALVQVGSAIKDGLADLLDRLLTGVGIAALAVGCQSGDAATVSHSEPATQAEKAAPAPAPRAETEAGPRPLGPFNVTFYYVIGEDEVVAKRATKVRPANDNTGPVTSPSAVDASESTELAAIAAPPEPVTIYTGKCEPIANVAPEYFSQLALQGTGKLKDGRVLNVWGTCSCAKSPCFKVVEQAWGTSGSGRPLQPFRTVAVDPRRIKLGSLLYMPLLEGRTMPGRAPWGGFVHDGCLMADDVGGGIKGNQLDLFVGRKGWFLGMSGKGSSHAWARHVPVYDGSKLCERKGRRVSRKSGAI